MTLDLTQFHESFFEESFEAIDSMEAALLKLEVGVADDERINTIFRGAHSMKGGAAMLGFAAVTSFTHTLETLLDELRSGHMRVTAPILDSLLKSVDVLREMLRAVQRNQPVDAQRVADLQFDLEAIVARKDALGTEAQPDAGGNTGSAKSAAGGSATGADGRNSADATAVSGSAAAPPTGWLIQFIPLPHLLLRGNDPLAIFAALAELGQVEAIADLTALPRLAELDPLNCHLKWQLRLQSDCSRARIEEVFDWTTGDCELLIERADASPPVTTEVSAAGTSAPASASASASASESAAPPAAASAASKAAATQASSPPPAASATQAAPAAPVAESSSIRVGIDKIDELINTVGELVITQAMLSELGRGLEGAQAELLRSGLSQLERNMRQLQESVMRVRMLPISVAFSRFPRMVRDLAQRLGKQIELILAGEQTELDKTVLEKIGDPLVHLVRNSIDHGIESPEVRIAAGKPAFGTIRLNAYHRGGNIAVEVNDDGAGLDHDRILSKARSRGLVGANDVLTDDQVNDLIFLPGFSTAEKTTEVSGRGVGMDVVRQRVKELGGAVDIRTERGRGSRFLITLPLTLSIVDGQSIAVGGENYIVPLTSIIESLQLKTQSVSRLCGAGEVFSFRGEYLPIVRLHDLFGIEPRSRSLHDGLVVVAEGDGKRVGLFVDELCGQQQVVIKSIESNYGHIEGVSGATILGDGSIALILDLPGLIRAASLRVAA
jgi:two-component system, chemotaxis family, sensor kinase CheA